MKDRLTRFLECGGQIQFMEPHFTVRDAAITSEAIEPHRQAISRLTIPAISRMIPGSVTTDMGSVGFNFFSQTQPPAGICVEWSNTYPVEWEPLISELLRLREALQLKFRG